MMINLIAPIAVITTQVIAALATPPIARPRWSRGARNPADNAERMLVLHLRTSRRKARAAAAAEVLATLASERTRET